MELDFEFEPTFSKVEEFLKTYQRLCAQNQNAVLRIRVSSDFWTAQPGYTNTESNSWLTLSYAYEQMNRSYLRGSSLVRVEAILRENP